MKSKLSKPPERIDWEGAAKNPSYDKNLPMEARLYDFLGKYYINLNGVVPNNYPEITEPHKKEIVDFVIKYLVTEAEARGERKMKEKIEKAAKDHYWDSLSDEKSLILKHLKGIFEFLKLN
jgi:hypothetical protein